MGFNSDTWSNNKQTGDGANNSRADGINGFWYAFKKKTAVFLL